MEMTEDQYFLIQAFKLMRDFTSLLIFMLPLSLSLLVIATYITEARI